MVAPPNALLEVGLHSSRPRHHFRCIGILVGGRDGQSCSLQGFRHLQLVDGRRESVGIENRTPGPVRLPLHHGPGGLEGEVFNSPVIVKTGGEEIHAVGAARRQVLFENPISGSDEDASELRRGCREVRAT